MGPLPEPPVDLRVADKIVIDTLKADLATETAARVAAEGRAGKAMQLLLNISEEYYLRDEWRDQLTVLIDADAAALASPDHATATDPATVAAMRKLLWSVVAEVDDDFDGFSWVRNEILEFFGLDPNTEHWPVRGEMPNGAE